MDLDLKKLTEAQLEKLLHEINTELNNRALAPYIEQGKVEIVTELQSQGKLSKPKTANKKDIKNAVEKRDLGQVPAWVNPGTDHAKMYKLGEVIKHNGELYESTHKGLNSWEPGAQGIDDRIWRLIPQLVERPAIMDEIPESEPNQPTTPPVNTNKWKAGVKYSQGQEVSYKGKTYRVVQAHTSQPGWEPSNVSALWSALS